LASHPVLGQHVLERPDAQHDVDRAGLNGRQFLGRIDPDRDAVAARRRRGAAASDLHHLGRQVGTDGVRELSCEGQQVAGRPAADLQQRPTPRASEELADDSQAVGQQLSGAAVRLAIVRGEAVKMPPHILRRPYPAGDQSPAPRTLHDDPPDTGIAVLWMLVHH
jgi:hypothetical protein